MPTTDEMCENVRLRLGDPRAQAPNDQAVLNQVCSQVRTLLRHKRATGNPWDFNDLIIQVQPNNATYAISQPDFGQALAVITHDPTNPVWIPRLVKIYEPQNLVLNIPALSNQYASWSYLPYDNSNCTAQRVAFYWRANVAYAEFWPLPMQSAQYKVRYLQNVAGQVDQQALSSSPLPNEDCDLAELRAALGLLAISEWYEPSSKDGRAANAERRRDLLVTLRVDELEARRQFEVAARITTGPRQYERWNPTTV
jgi:hypothetical protein